MIFLRIFQESLQFAWHALTVNKLRTFLSLIGVTIGILTMVSVFTIFDSLESSIRGSVQNLGSNVIYVQKWPWGGSGEYPWWKYYQRPEPSFDELAQLERRMETAEILAYAFGKSQTVNFGRNTVEGVDVISISHRFNDIWQHEFQAGRYFSVLESQRGSPVTVLGADVAEALFPAGNALGQNIRILGRKLRVIGVLVKEGSSLVGNNVDGALWVPANYTRSLMSLKNREGAFIMAKARPEVELSQMRDELEGHMRAMRRLKPRAENDFALNEISLISNSLDSLFGVIGTAGLVIGGFSILVGGFGIANIMFVSVRERTNQIGIQKSLGAKRHFILLQFLLEAMILCLLGGALGILIVAGAIPIFASDFDFDVALSVGNVMQGLMISAAVGLISGFVPALMAARLDPVEAIRRGN